MMMGMSMGVSHPHTNGMRMGMSLGMSLGMSNHHTLGMSSSMSLGTMMSMSQGVSKAGSESIQHNHPICVHDVHDVHSSSRIPHTLACWILHVYVHANVYLVNSR